MTLESNSVIETLFGALRDTFVALASPTQQAISAHLFRDAMTCIQYLFGNGEQQDVMELFGSLINALDKTACIAFTRLFSGINVFTTRCLHGHVSEVQDDVFFLPLEIVPHRHCESITACLRKFLQPDSIEGENAYDCITCRSKVPAIRECRVLQRPEILVIQLKRFSPGLQKNESPIFINSEILLGDAFAYDLCSFVLHHGASIERGHYSAVARHENDSWYRFDDSAVRPINIAVIQRDH
jgi:ubiquitin C-terminal hydrolase